MSVNDQYSDPGAIFPSGATYTSTGAPGGGGATEADALADTAFRVPVTSPYMSVQNTTPPMVGVGADDTGLPGQATEGFSGQHLTSTGAGEGRVGGPGHPNSHFGAGPQL